MSTVLCGGKKTIKPVLRLLFLCKLLRLHLNHNFTIGSSGCFNMKSVPFCCKISPSLISLNSLSLELTLEQALAVCVDSGFS